MKKCVILLTFMLLIFTLCSCNILSNRENNSITEGEIVINYPTDNTVNGYRSPSAEVTESPVVNYNSSASQSTGNKLQYCGNINSKVFHLSSCSSVKKMKEDNKYYSSDRPHLIEEGFSPCERCKP